jgi:hypothetical protein
VALGKLVEGAETYHLAIRMPLPPDAPAALLRAQDQARTELAALEPHVPRLTLTITPGAEHLAIEIDGKPLNVAAAGEPIPLDPGEHQVIIRAPGYMEVRLVVGLVDSDAKRLDAILRTESEGPEETSTTSPRSPSTGSVQRTVGLAAGGIGVVGLIVGSVFGLVAKSTYDGALAGCPNGPPSPCSPQAVAESGTAHDQATVSTVGFVAGGLLLAGGAALYLTAPREHDVSVGPTVVGSGAGLGVRGTW